MNKTTVIIAGLLALALIVGAAVGIFIVGSSPAPVASQNGADSTSDAAAPAVAKPVEQKPAVKKLSPPSFDVVRVSPDGFAVFAGRAEPGWSVDVHDKSQVFGTEKADGRGEWVLAMTTPLAPGSYEFRLLAKSPNATRELASKKTVLIVVPERKKGEKGVPLVVEMGDDDKGGSRVLQGEGVGANQTARQLTLDAIDYAPDGSAVMSGSAPPSSSLRVYMDNQLLGDSATGDGSRWQVDTGKPVGGGAHLVRIDQIDESGKVIARVEAVFEHAPEGAQAASSGEQAGDDSNYQVKPGNSLWRIARRYYGDGFMYTEIFQANRSRIQDPDLIYPGQIFVLPRPTEEIAN